MHDASLPNLNNVHDTAIGSERSESRTRGVVLVTAVMMVIEIVVGQLTGSMALLADGWHMATHVGALGLSAAAYWFARTRSGHRAFTFGTGKVYALAGYTSAVCLALVALIMGFESVSRLVHPVTIHFREAMPVAVIGLIVNLVSVKLLDHDEQHEHDHEQQHDHESSGVSAEHHRDHNLRAAYFHVLADAMTSVLAIAALCAGQFFRWTFLDPVMGIVGGLVILKWSWGLCRGAARQLLDACASLQDEDRLRAELETIDDVRVVDLHLWEVGPGRSSCIASLVTSEPREADFYRSRARSILDLCHITVEVHRCQTGHECHA
jgi:cation diffusion facilitator family transporter